MNYHNVKAEQAVALLFSSNQGLSTKEAEKRLRENGNNEIKGEKKKSLLQRFLLQLYDFSIIILLIAAAVSYFVSYMSGEPDFTDTAVILAIV
ncbi:MAG TPA: cation-transporting P-type ATPase, partial [Clostridiales bacterium]|nr:cation-transporting P-type ATPase [Clostridiales bacterium]